jgi:fructose-bisphosphate aldolase class II
MTATYEKQVIIYTKPDDAAEIRREESGVDTLAVAIGTCHGLYPAGMKPELKLDILKEIKSRVSIPLVLHGGSNNPDEEIGKSVTLGINKINISSDIKVAYYTKMREVLKDEGLREPNMIEPPCIEAMEKVASQKIHLFQDGRGHAGNAVSSGHGSVRKAEDEKPLSCLIVRTQTFSCSHRRKT